VKVIVRAHLYKDNFHPEEAGLFRRQVNVLVVLQRLTLEGKV
jgi:hypothetical protein